MLFVSSTRKFELAPNYLHSPLIRRALLETVSYFARARISLLRMPVAKKVGATRNQRRKSSKRHSLDHLLASYAPSQLRSSSPNRNTNGRAKKKSATSSTATKATNTKTMAAKKPADKPSERTSRRRQPLDPAVAAFFDPKTSVGADLLSPGGGAVSYGKKNERSKSRASSRGAKESKTKKPLKVKKTATTKKPAAPSSKKKTPAKRGRSTPARKVATKKMAVPKAPQNSTQYIMAERRRKSRPERPIKNLTSPRAERLASPGVPPKSNLNMFGSMMPQALKGEEEEDVEEDLDELIGDIFNEKPLVAAAKKSGGNGSRRGSKSQAESSLYDAQNALIESQAKRIGELQNEIIRLKMKLRDYEDEKIMADANVSQRLMKRMKGLFKF